MCADVTHKIAAHSWRCIRQWMRNWVDPIRESLLVQSSFRVQLVPRSHPLLCCVLARLVHTCRMSVCDAALRGRLLQCVLPCRTDQSRRLTTLESWPAGILPERESLLAASVWDSL